MKIKKVKLTEKDKKIISKYTEICTDFSGRFCNSNFLTKIDIRKLN